jgi:hypothetical protein
MDNFISAIQGKVNSAGRCGIRIRAPRLQRRYRSNTSVDRSMRRRRGCRSGGLAPATQNLCLGVWVQTGRYTYQLNHFALGYDATTGLLNGKANIAETVTLSPGGTIYSGTFAITNFDTNGNKVGPTLTGQITADRITVDTTTP